MFRKIITSLAILVILAGCSVPTAEPVPTEPGPTETAVQPTQTATLLPPTPIPSATLIPSITPTLLPSPTLTPTFIPAGRIPIIEYHDPEFRLSDQVQMSLDWFAAQMAWLADNGFHTLSDEDLAAYLDGTQVFPQKSVVLTFDVGTAKRQNYTDVVIPTLKKYGFRAIFFIVSNESVEVDPCKPDKRFCWDDFRQWAEQGLISIGSHGLFHPDFTTLTAAQMKYELEQSKKILVEKTGVDPIAFAFPFDANNAATQAQVKAAGYQFAVAGNTRHDLVVLPNDADRYHLPRLYPYSNTHIYPMLTGYNRPFGDVVASLITPVAVSQVPTSQRTPTPARTPTGGTPPAATLSPGIGESNVEPFLSFCGSLPSDPYYRLPIMIKATFQTDLSPQAQANLVGLNTTPSCNFYGRDRPEAIVLHFTAGGDLNSSLSAFRQPNAASAHYIIERDGTVTQMVPEGLAALHVNCNGTRTQCVADCPICDGKDGGFTEPYTRSIGIEIVNCGRIPGCPGPYYHDYLRSFNYWDWEDYTDAQIASLKILVQDIAARWNIPIDAQHVIGHYRVNFKVDPGPALNLFWTRAGYPPKPPIFDTAVP